MFLRQESVVSAIGGRAALNGAAQNDPIINIRIARKIAVRKESDHEMKNAPLQERNHWWGAGIEPARCFHRGILRPKAKNHETQYQP